MLRSMRKVIKEQIKSFYLVRRLSFYEMKSDNNNHYLGILWELLNPLIQISVYAFVFGVGLRGTRAPVEGVDYLSWLLAGISVWFFINQGVVQGSKSIYSRIRMVSKMSFPISVIPTYVIFAKFYQHLMLLAVIFIILQFTGHPISIQFIQLPYYMFASLVLLVSFSLITSTLATIVRDVQMIVQSLMRILLYLSPILWNPITLNLEHHPVLEKVIKTVLLANPFYYIIEGYRSALLGHSSWFALTHVGYTVYFWCLVLILLFIGPAVHVKFRDRFVDYL